MRITHFEDTDSLMIVLRDEAEPGGYATDLTEDGNVTAHYSEGGELLGIEVQGHAGEVFDIGNVTVERVAGGRKTMLGYLAMACWTRGRDAGITGSVLDAVGTEARRDYPRDASRPEG